MTNLDDAQMEFSGYVKWDGCSEFDIFESHVCSRHGLKELTEMVLTAYDLAGKAMGDQFEGNTP